MPPPNPTTDNLDDDGGDEGGRRPRRWFPYAAVLLVVAALLGGLWWVGSKITTPEQRAADALPPAASPIAVPVEDRVLSDTIITRGDVKPDGAVDVVWSGTTEGSTAIVTGVPHQIGGEVVEGQVVVEVSGRPVFLLAGTLPIYRDLRPGSHGDDVGQLQDALTRLGFEPNEHDGIYGPGTKVAVEAWYRAAGYDPALTSADAAKQLGDAQAAVQTAVDGLDAAKTVLVQVGASAVGSAKAEAQAGFNAAQRALNDARTAQTVQVGQAQIQLDTTKTALARLQADPAADPAVVDEAKLAVSSADANLTTITADTATSVANAQDALIVAGARLEEAKKGPTTSAEQLTVDVATRGVWTAQAAYDTLNSISGVMVPATEIVVIPTAPAHVAAQTAVVGVKAEGKLVTLTSAGLIIESLLDVSAKQLVAVGAAVTIDSELSGDKLTATVTAIAAEPVVPSETNGGQSGFPVTITPTTALTPEWLGRNVRVTITNATTTQTTLVVPEAAVYARADGTQRVTVYNDTTGQSTDVEVTVGLTAGGYASITPTTSGSLKPGDLVVVGTQPAPVTAPAA